MTLDRRAFLSASLQAGALLAASPTLAAPRDAGMATRLVILRRGGDDAFAAAAAAAWVALGGAPPSEIDLTDALVYDPAALHQALAVARDGRLVGLLDAVADTMIEAAIRDRDGTILCRGAHAVGPNGASRHRFDSLPASQGIGNALAGAVGERALVTEMALHPIAEAGDGTRLTRADWPVALGTAAALIAAGRWRAGPLPIAPRPTEAPSWPARRSYASLIAAI